jgi:hypothetical protein
MKSIGKGQGYRCAICGRKTAENEAEFTSRTREVKTGWYEPPVGSRRHLSKPLKREYRIVVIKAADEAEKVLSYYERQHPKDFRPRKAIEAARAWARGDIKCGKARKAALAAHAAARDANNKVEEYAARAAGHAAASAHVATHAESVVYYIEKIKSIQESDARPYLGVGL